MAHLIRFISSAAASLIFVLLVLKVFGEFDHRKAVAVVFVFSLCAGIFTFAKLLESHLDSPQKRLIGLASIPIALLFLGLLFSNDAEYALSSMVRRRLYQEEYILWGLLLSTLLVPWLAFKYDSIVTPLLRWIKNGKYGIM